MTVLSYGVVILPYVAILAILFLMIFAVVSYIQNRGMPDEASKKVLAWGNVSKEFTAKLDILIQEIRKSRSNEED